MIRRKSNSKPFSKKCNVHGVRTYLHQIGFIMMNDQDDIIQFYCSDEIKFDLTKSNWIRPACLEIQKDFPRFVEWMRKEILTK